jgi:hypothetical protein
MDCRNDQPKPAAKDWPMISANLLIYDVTRTPAPRVPVQKTLDLVREDEDNLIFRWTNDDEEPVEGTLGIVDWDEFVGQVREREPARWVSDSRLSGPMGEGDLPKIVRQVKTTPAYQLFLAAMDVAAFLGLYQSGGPDPLNFLTYSVFRRFVELRWFVPTITDGGRLFFVSDDLVSNKDEAVVELLRNGKLGKVTLRVGDKVLGQKYYVPYATPIGFTTEVSTAAKRLWDAIRDEYFERRG